MALFHPLALLWMKKVRFLTSLLAFRAFDSYLVFILLFFACLLYSCPQWCSWQVSGMPKSELVNLMPVKCWGLYVTKTERKEFPREVWRCSPRSHSLYLNLLLTGVLWRSAVFPCPPWGTCHPYRHGHRQPPAKRRSKYYAVTCCFGQHACGVRSGSDQAEWDQPNSLLCTCLHLPCPWMLGFPLRSKPLESRLPSWKSGCLLQNYHKAPFSQTCPLFLPCRLNAGGALATAPVWIWEIVARIPGSCLHKNGRGRFGWLRQARVASNLWLVGLSRTLHTQEHPKGLWLRRRAEQRTLQWGEIWAGGQKQALHQGGRSMN